MYLFTIFFEKYRYKLKTRIELLAKVGSYPRQEKIILCHGVFDEMVPVMMGRNALDAMVQAGNPCEWNGYRMGHEVNLPELNRIKEWLHDALQ